MARPIRLNVNNAAKISQQGTVWTPPRTGKDCLMRGMEKQSLMIYLTMLSHSNDRIIIVFLDYCQENIPLCTGYRNFPVKQRITHFNLPTFMTANFLIIPAVKLRRSE